MAEQIPPEGEVAKRPRGEEVGEHRGPEATTKEQRERGEGLSLTLTGWRKELGGTLVSEMFDAKLAAVVLYLSAGLRSFSLFAFFQKSSFIPNFLPASSIPLAPAALPRQYGFDRRPPDHRAHPQGTFCRPKAHIVCR